MSLRGKFVTAILASIIFIAVVNIAAFYMFYSIYLKIYLYEKIEARENITLEYIKEIKTQQTVDEIESLFDDTEIEFFELLENNNGSIPLDSNENIDIIVTYLAKSGLSPKYIENIIPTDNFKKTIDAIRTPNTQESIFVQRIIYSVLLVNVIAVSIVVGLLFIFIRKTLTPVTKITTDIKKLNESLKNSNKSIDYNLHYDNKNDEIGLLVQAINNLNKRLGVQNTIRTRLLADISHELKTPITSIQTYLEGISDGVIELNKKNLTAISTEMQRLINLVNMIMDYERFDRKKFQLKKEEVDVPELLKIITETHKKRLISTKQRIKITGDQELFIDVDKDLFSQVVHNLIENFLKYAGKKSLLTVNVTKKYIDFHDNGKGIKSNEIPFLTEKFYQGDEQKTGDAEKRGIGVGLSIVTKIIESHGWRYEIISEKNKGFSFKIFIS